MPLSPNNIPNAHAAATLFVRALNETQPTKNCTAPKNSTEYTPSQCAKEVNIVSSLIGDFGFRGIIVGIFLVLSLGFCFITSKSRRNPSQGRPPGYEQGNKSVDTLPIYKEVNDGIELPTFPPPSYTVEAAGLRGEVDSQSRVEGRRALYESPMST